MQESYVDNVNAVFQGSFCNLHPVHVDRYWHHLCLATLAQLHKFMSSLLPTVEEMRRAAWKADIKKMWIAGILSLYQIG